MNNQFSQAETLIAHPKRRNAKKFPTMLSCLIGVILCIVLVVTSFGGYYFVASTGEAGPLVLIHAPENEAQLASGEIVTIQAVASDENKITRVELWVDDQLLRAEASSTPNGITSFPLLTEWQADSAGTHTIMVRAFNSRGVRAHSTIRVEVDENLDRDNDGVADDVDTPPGGEHGHVAERYK